MPRPAFDASRSILAVCALAIGCGGPGDAPIADGGDAGHRPDATATSMPDGAGETPDAGIVVPMDCARFADNHLTGDCDTYDPATRSCTGGSKPAYTTLAAAVDSAQAGDVICARAGDYDEDLEIGVSGTESAPITLAAFSGEGCQGGIGDHRSNCQVRIVGPDAAVTVSGSYVVLDGLAVVHRGFQGYVLTVHDVDHVTIRNCELDGAFQGADNHHTGGACSGVSLDNTSYVTFDLNEIHSNADDGLELYNSNHLVVRHNEVHGLHACGTDDTCIGPCYNGHSDGFEGTTLDDSLFDGNLVYDINSTSAFIFGDAGNAPDTVNLTIVNNVFYTPETGFAAYFQGVNGLFLYHNVIWGRLQGAYGGLSLGRDVRNLEMIDNIILSINYAHLGGAYDAAEHHGDYNVFGYSTGQYQEQSHDQVADPGFASIRLSDQLDDFLPFSDVRADSFRLMTSSPAYHSAVVTAATPDHDFYDVLRGATPNIGAIE